ncbi:MAG: type IV pilus assembly protein PilM [bacterium]|nr:type IV pilus assembly protein PilM [bacterium]
MDFSKISNIFSSWRKIISSRRILGIDIGTVSLKAIELEKQGKDLMMTNYGILETTGYLTRSNEALQTSSLKIVEKEVAEKLKTLLREMKPKTQQAIGAIPLFSVFSTTLEVPFLDYKETEKIINFQAKQYLPVPVSEMTLDWWRTGEFENQRGQRFQRILVTAIPREVVEKYKRIFKMAGLRLVALEVESVALNRSLSSADGSPVAIIDIGAESTSVAISEKGELRHNGQFDYGGLSLTYAIARSLDISNRRAEELKRRRGLSGTGGEFELSTSLIPFLDVIIQEVKRVCEVYEKTYGKKIERLFLVGGGANLVGLNDYFSQQLGVRPNDPIIFSGIKYSSSLELIIKQLNRELAVSAGLALKYFQV